MTDIKQHTIPDDNELIAGLKLGNQQAFESLFNKYWEKAFNQAYKRLKNEEDAKDVVQEFFTAIWLKRESLYIDNFTAYLYTSIRNNTLKLLQRQHTDHSFFNVENTLQETSALPDTAIVIEEFLQAYQDLLETLTPQCRTVFQMKFNEQLSTKEISVKLNIKRKTVQNHLGKAIHQLKLSLLRFLILVIFLAQITR